MRVYVTLLAALALLYITWPFVQYSVFSLTGFSSSLLGIIFTKQLFSILLHLKPNIPTSPLPSTWLVTISHFTPKLAAILLWHIHIKFNLKLNKCQETFKIIRKGKTQTQFRKPFSLCKTQKKGIKTQAASVDGTPGEMIPLMKPQLKHHTLTVWKVRTLHVTTI